jgi:hypothetical protein
MASVTANQEREMRIAIERIVGFAQEFGEAHLNLACHAAFPLALTPDLLYQLWANFVPEAPWTAVARVLLSRLCQQVGFEMYEMELAVRNLLLKELKEQFGAERLEDLAGFLLEYVGQRLTEDDLDTQDLREAQEWTALAYTEPTEAAHQLAKALSKKVTENDMAELFRLTSLAETLGEPLIEAGFEPLLVYSRGLESFVRGDLNSAASKIGELLLPNRPLEMAGVTLPIPAQIASELEQTEPEPQSVSPTTSRKLCSTFIIAFGGTGAKCVESIIHLAATGLFPEEPIGILFVDPDETNGNVERARRSMQIYQLCYDLMSGDKQQYSWLQTPIEFFGLWSPLNRHEINHNLESFFNYHRLKQNNEALSNLFEVLYTEEERRSDCNCGFRGKPAIGAAIMSSLTLDDFTKSPWASLIEQVKISAAMGKSPKIFLCGSTFGGTGSSGIPVISCLIYHWLCSQGLHRHVQIGSLLLLPYFQFPAPLGADSSELYARPEQLSLNTNSTLGYCATEEFLSKFHVVYLLGSQPLSRLDQFSIGGLNQRNKPQFIELFAGLALRHFVLNTFPERGAVVLLGRENSSKVTWDDIPERGVVKAKLANTTRFAYAWLTVIAPELESAKQMGVDSFSRSVRWFAQFFRHRSFFRGKKEELPDFIDSREQETLHSLNNWCEAYLTWLSNLHQSEYEEIELFKAETFLDLDRDGRLRPKEDAFANLIFGDARDPISRSKDTPRRLMAQLDPKLLSPPNQGTAGLAKALYLLCQI